MKALRNSFIVLLCGVLLSACQSAPQSASLLAEPPAGIAQVRRIDSLPFFPQERYHCGPAALATVLAASGVVVTPDELVSQVYVPERQGSFQTEMMAAARSRGRLVYQLDASLADIIREVDAGHSVLVLQNLGLNSLPQWHFAVVKGYDLASGSILLNSGVIEDYENRLRVFERTWARGEHWAITVTDPQTLPVTATPERLFQSLAALQHSYPEFETLNDAYRRGLERWPGHRSLLMGQGNLLLENADLEQAIGTYKSVLVDSPDYAPAHNNLAHAYLQSHRLDLARAHAESALAQGDRFADIYAQTLAEIEAAAAAGDPKPQ